MVHRQLKRDEGELEGQLFAAVDLGSNSFHMLVARYDHGNLQVIDRLKEMVRLAGGVDDAGQLDSQTGQSALDCLARFGQRLQQIPDDNIVAVGTNAMRRIQGFDFLGQAEAALGQAIQIISGEEEARLIYRGVAQGISERGNQRLVIDIGGGSTEFVIGRKFRPVKLESLYFGCVSITQRFFTDGRINAKRWRRAKTAVAQELQRIANEYRNCGWQEALGSSGTMKSVRNVCVAAGFCERGITPLAMQQLRDALISVGHSDQLDLPGLSDRRQPVFAGGAAVIDACIDELGIEQVIVTDYALREGLLYNLLGKILHEDPRDGTVDGLLTKYHVDREQSDRVKQTALSLYEQVADDWTLPTATRDWLGWGAQLHELGLTIGHHGYHRHGSYLIGSADLPGFSKLDQQVIAILVGNHRRKPSTDDLGKTLARLRGDIKRLTVLLRLAVLFCRTRSSDTLPTIALMASDDTLEVKLDSQWLTMHPLTRADLKDEAGMLRDIDINLILV